MEAILFGSAGFVLYFLYDVNSITIKNKILQKFFAFGSVLVVGSFLYAVKIFGRTEKSYSLDTALFAIGGILFLLLLIYTLFFALPFEETYCQENQMRLTYKEGVYSLCRHPGVLWYAGLSLCLWGLTGNPKGGLFFCVMILWNVVYVIFQDRWIFLETFSDYKEYKMETPFLIPNGQSIRKCIRYYKRKLR